MGDGGAGQPGFRGQSGGSPAELLVGPAARRGSGWSFPGGGSAGLAVRGGLCAVTGFARAGQGLGGVRLGRPPSGALPAPLRPKRDRGAGAGLRRIRFRDANVPPQSYGPIGMCRRARLARSLRVPGETWVPREMARAGGSGWRRFQEALEGRILPKVLKTGIFSEFVPQVALFGIGPESGVAEFEGAAEGGDGFGGFL